MTQAERDALNVEYVVVCKGWKATAISSLLYWTDAEGFLTAVVPDYLSDEADAWRRIKALIDFGASPEFYIYDEKYCLMCRVSDEINPNFTDCGSPGEATLRACIALKVRVL